MRPKSKLRKAKRHGQENQTNFLDTETLLHFWLLQQQCFYRSKIIKHTEQLAYEAPALESPSPCAQLIPGEGTQHPTSAPSSTSPFSSHTESAWRWKQSNGPMNLAPKLLLANADTSHKGNYSTEGVHKVTYDRFSPLILTLLFY